MRLTKDLHTHTIYSHGTGTVAQMVESARKKGLSEIHITEHGYSHYYARKLNRARYLEMKSEIDRIQIEYPNIKIVFGAEANIFSAKGDIDLNDEDIAIFDVVNIGFHVLCRMKDMSSYFKIHFLAVLAYRCRLKMFEKISIKYCTQAMLSALDKYPIHMITHPLSNYKFDLLEIAKKCEQTGTILEINNARGKLNTQDVKLLKDMNVLFAVGSDAHKPENVGKCETSFQIIADSGLSIDKIVNVEE